MNIKRRDFTKLAAGTAASSYLFGAPAFAQQKPIRIGLLAPRAGVAAIVGEDSIRGRAKNGLHCTGARPGCQAPVAR